MSDTPETDKVMFREVGGPQVVLVHVARKMEVERNMARKETKEAWEEIAEACQDWLDSIIQEPAVDFIKAIRDWAKKKASGENK